MQKIDLNVLLKAGVHFGHQTSKWNPKMSHFIFTKKEGIHIINLQKTQKKLEEALEFVEEIVSKGSKILFVGTKRQAKGPVKKAAEECGMPYIVERWPGGAFTNFKTIKKQIDKLRNLNGKQKSGEFEKYTKKEQILFKDEIERLERLFGGLIDMEKLPGAIFVVNVAHDKTSIKEATKENVPIISLADTNINPEIIDYPIPANDDAIKSIELMCSIISEKIKESFKEPLIKDEENKVINERK